MPLASVHTGGWHPLSLRETLSFPWHCSSCTVYGNVLRIQQRLLSSIFSLFARKQDQLVLSALPREGRPGAKGATFSVLMAMASVPLFYHRLGCAGGAK